MLLSKFNRLVYQLHHTLIFKGIGKKSLQLILIVLLIDTFLLIYHKSLPSYQAMHIDFPR